MDILSIRQSAVYQPAGEGLSSLEENWWSSYRNPVSTIVGGVWIGFFAVNCYTLWTRIHHFASREENERPERIDALVRPIISGSVDTASSLSYVVGWMHEIHLIDIGDFFPWLAPFANISRLISSATRSFIHAADLIEAEEMIEIAQTKSEKKWAEDKEFIAILNLVATVAMWAFATLTLLVLFAPGIVLPIFLLPGLLLTSWLVNCVSIGCSLNMRSRAMPLSFELHRLKSPPVRLGFDL